MGGKILSSSNTARDIRCCRVYNYRPQRPSRRSNDTERTSSFGQEYMVDLFQTSPNPTPTQGIREPSRKGGAKVTLGRVCVGRPRVGQKHILSKPAARGPSIFEHRCSLKNQAVTSSTMNFPPKIGLYCWYRASSPSTSSTGCSSLAYQQRFL